jgi:hypothetical protein
MEAAVELTAPVLRLALKWIAPMGSMMTAMERPIVPTPLIASLEDVEEIDVRPRTSA